MDALKLRVMDDVRAQIKQALEQSGVELEVEDHEIEEIADEVIEQVKNDLPKILKEAGIE